LSIITDNLDMIGAGLATTLAIALLAYAGALVVGTLVAVGMTVVEAFGSVFVYRMVSFVMITLLGWVVYFFTYTRKGLSARDAT